MGESAQFQAEVDTFDFPDFAQEFLRRNRDYRAQYSSIARISRVDPGARACREMAHSWGLIFPVSA